MRITFTMEEEVGFVSLAGWEPGKEMEMRHGPLLTTGTSALTWKPQQCGLPSALTGSLRTSVVFTYCTLLYADTGDVTGILFFACI